MKITLALIILLIFSQGCTMFDKGEHLLAEHQEIDGNKIKIYYVSLGATTNDVIQVRRSNNDTVLWVSDKYNYLASSKLINDTCLKLILSDTGYHNHDNKLDTIIVNIRLAQNLK